ncbi:hypothetical protein [Carboxylicivirga sp. M1479]|uniref:hypothetical protein n=1 Tax=Carboxylicivirga sp. M1479 TaxID=2594476 RepID=UPI00117813F8|nr:hypothetical protein [Carboxylicivirga sp. M1479]TRX63296.1 hypothetical protein FNN09_18775 [Carboxylicivirga sp. M1479]
MLIGLITLIIMLLSGPEQVFMIKGLQKEVRQHVDDKERKKEIIQIIKTSRKTIEKETKNSERKAKDFYKDLKDYPCDFTMIKQHLDNHNAKEKELQSMLIENRLKLQELLTTEEWQLIIEPSIHPKPKMVRKKLKTDIKMLSTAQKHFKNIEKILKEGDTNKEDLANINKLFQKFKDSNIAMLHNIANNNFNSTKILRDQTCSRADINAFYNEQSKHRQAVRQSFIELIEVTQKAVTQKQWQKIRYNLKKIIII